MSKHDQDALMTQEFNLIINKQTVHPHGAAASSVHDLTTQNGLITLGYHLTNDPSKGNNTSYFLAKAPSQRNAINPRSIDDLGNYLNSQ